MENKEKLKLFIWENFEPDWSSGLAFAIAEDVVEAKALVEKAEGKVENWGRLQVRSVSRPIARSVIGGS